MTTEIQPELIPMGVGDILRSAREKRGWSLEMIAQDIKVRPEVLRSIEAGDTGHIPSVYLKGYIRSYARQLGIQQSLIEEHVAGAQGHEPAVQSVFEKGLPRNKFDRWFKASSYVLASAVVIALVWQFTTEAVRFSQGDPLLRPAQVDGSPSASSQTDTDQADINPLPGTETAPAKTHLRASIASMNMAEEQTITQRPMVAEGAWAAIGNRDTAGSTPDSLPHGTEALEVITSADSWVEIVDGKGKQIEMDLLRAGSKRTYNGAAPFRLLLGRASSVEVFHDGEKVDLAPYTRGNVARLTLGAEESAPEPAASLDSESSAKDFTAPDKS